MAVTGEVTEDSEERRDEAAVEGDEAPERDETSARRHETSPRRDESETERLDRNLGELLQELRVALPGVQVLFAFLLVVPFQQRFSDITSFQRSLYFVTLLLATAASTCLIAPTAHHRIEFRAQDKRRIVFSATKLAVVGLALLAAAMTGAVMLITDFLYHTTTVVIVAGAVALLFITLWFAWPVKRLLDNQAGG